jgi:hypothetical protein
MPGLHAVPPHPPISPAPDPFSRPRPQKDPETDKTSTKRQCTDTEPTATPLQRTESMYIAPAPAPDAPPVDAAPAGAAPAVVPETYRKYWTPEHEENLAVILPQVKMDRDDYFYLHKKFTGG